MFFNRELSWLKFNERVLLEATQKESPILERLKFCAIFSSNLDEFFMVRVATIKDQINVGYDAPDPSNLTPTETFSAIYSDVRELIAKQQVIENECLKTLEEDGIYMVEDHALTEEDEKHLKTFFDINVFPVLTPMGVDFSRPFPLISNMNIYIAVKLSVEGVDRLALVQVPSVLERFVKLPSENGALRYILLENVIKMYISELFSGYEVLTSCVFRITRNGDIHLIEDGAEDLLEVIEEAVKNRKWGETIRLEIEANMDVWLTDVLKRALQIEDDQIYCIPGHLDKTMWFKFNPPKVKHKLSLPVYVPKVLPYMRKKNIFKTIRDQDIFVQHPYDSFSFVTDFLKQASKDENVLAIKQTLYRVSGNSEIVKALGDAAESGKQVTVLVELMARFDEENNINWAKKLEQKGAHVIYGLYGLKTHSKITLVVRREKKRIRRYVHLGTGNYNDQTAKLYTDMGLFTCKESYGMDATIFFNIISGFSHEILTNKFTVSPYHMREKFMALIDREIEYVQNEKKGYIIAKMNSLVDVGIIQKLYEASQKGVKIDLIIRGICTLVPGVAGLSENISVTSIVGRFLEHSRIYYFQNDQTPEVYLSSADWMTRNLDRRIEILFPVETPEICERVRKTLNLYLADTQKSWRLTQEGVYIKKAQVSPDAKPFNVQNFLSELEYEDTVTFNHIIDERM